MKNNIIYRLISNPAEAYKKARILLRYRKSRSMNRSLLDASKKIDFHYGVWGIGNAGDIVLFREVENAIQKDAFYQRDLGSGEIDEAEVELLNQKGRLMVLGGGGLFLKDSNSNSNSGWQFNIKSENLDQLQVPLVIFAVGYNRFRGQEDFDEIFEKHLLKTVEKASFIGLRNQGSISSIKEYLPNHLKEKIRFQPCPTTIIKQLHPGVSRKFTFTNQNEKKIAINIAFDREEKRFKGKLNEVISAILASCKYWKSEGWTVEFVGHCKADKKIKAYLKGAFPFKDLTYDSYEEIIAYYKNVPLTIGMRGHAQMIPFGIGNAIISLISHNKMKWFLDDIKHPEWGIEILGDHFQEELLEKSKMVIDQFEEVQNQVDIAQGELFEVTRKNVEMINNLQSE